LRKIKGRGAFRRFKEAIHWHCIVEDWYRFREESFKKIARDRLELNEIDYDDD
jgi:hypothetical protein